MLNAPKESTADEDGLTSVAPGDDTTETIKPSDVDAFWLQRILNKHYNDADVSQVRRYL